MLTFVVPGRLDQITGGYLYDRRVVEGLRARGREIDVVELPGRFPDADAFAREAAARSLAALPERRVVVIDGLALPAYADCMADHARRLRIVGLVHHPLHLETGLSTAEAARYAALESSLWADLHALVCPSAATAEALVQAGIAQERIEVVPPGTHRPSVAPQRITRNRLHLLAVGTVCARKGHHVLIEALAGLRDLSWQLDCIGSLERSPAYAEALRASIEGVGLAERVALCGELPPSQLSAAYACADVFVLPSFHEGYGMAYAEALAHGLPVIGTSGGAIPQTVPASAGLLVDPGDAVALRDAIRRVITDGPLRARLSEGAAHAGATLPTWPQAVDRWAACLDRWAS